MAEMMTFFLFIAVYPGNSGNPEALSPIYLTTCFFPFWM